MSSAGEPQPAVPGQGAGASDHSLLRRFRRGSQDAATQLYLRYAHRLRTLAQKQCSPDLARRVDADDIVQSVFGSFFCGASRGYYDVPAGEELWKLFLVIALNKIRAKAVYHRAAKRDVRLSAPANLLEDAEGAGRDEAAYTFLQLVIDEALERLPEPQRQMVLLRIEGHEVADIAREVQRSKRTVERVLQDFRQQLAGLLDAGD